MYKRVAVGVSIIALSAAGGYVANTHDNHKCDAPCAIQLPDNMQEDEFGVDFGWYDHNTPVVDIYAK